MYVAGTQYRGPQRTKKNNNNNTETNENRINIYKINNPDQNHPPSPSLPDCRRDPLCSNDVCDTSKSIAERAAAIVKALTLEEKVANLVSSAAGSSRLGLPAYQWQNEALHGVAGSTGVNFQSPLGANFSAATSFPMPIVLSAAFDDALVKEVATAISTEARAFANHGYAGLDYWTPNINPFRDPRWGRGMETPGEDAFRISNYVLNLVDGFQGGIDPQFHRSIATCKHFAGYDVEEGRTSNDVHPTKQDLADYYLPMFKTCVQQAKVGSIMCTYNSLDGIPTCASSNLLQGILRDGWNFTEPYNYVVSDCDSVENIFDPHHYAKDIVEASALGVNAGTDLDCGSTYDNLNKAVQQNLTTEAILNKSVTRLFAALVKVGFFDQPAEYNNLNWADVNTTKTQTLAHRAAVDGMTLLKNDGTLPLPKAAANIAVIGPWANVTDKMQGNYAGTAPLLVNPLDVFRSKWRNVKYARGTDIDSSDTSGFASAIDAAKTSDYILYLGGIDISVENEGHDRQSIAWTGNQLDLIAQLSNLGKPLVIVQFGGGQIDDSKLLQNKQVNSILWAGYPGQDGGDAIFDVLTGAVSPAGRLPVTQYPASYVDNNNILDMNLRPTGGVPGRTYMWYTGKAVLPFGHGLHYTNFSASWKSTVAKSYSIQDLVAKAGPNGGLSNVATLTANIKNTGGRSKSVSDYVGLLFLSSANAGPAPRPAKKLVSYSRVRDIGPGTAKELSLKLNLGELARSDDKGDRWIYPGDYTLALDTDASLTAKFTLTGQAAKLDAYPGK